MRKIGILGGTYNPPHIGHLIIANEVKNALGLDEVRLMPTALPPHKNADATISPVARLEMVKIAVKATEGLVASSFEIDRGGVSYTVDTMRQLTKEEPDAQFYFIIGGDMIDQLHKWYKIEELLELVSFIGVNRPGWKSETAFPITLVDIPEIDLSSTLLRERFKNGNTVKFLIPPEVEAYIVEEGLYGTN